MSNAGTLELPSTAPQHNDRRTLILGAVGAVVGLAIAGFGLFTAQGTRIVGVPADAVALVNGYPILRSDYLTLLESLNAGPATDTTRQQRREVLNQMIREELYVQRGIELGYQEDFIEVRNSLVQSVEVQQEIDANTAVPGEQELRAYYAQNPAKYSSEGRMTLTDYIAPSAASAQACIAAVRAGTPLERAVAAHGLKSSGAVDDGEEFYFAAAIHLGPRLFAVAKDLHDGAISDPVESAGQIHVLAMKTNFAPEQETFASAQTRVRNDFRADKIARMRLGVDQFLRERADIQIAKDLQ